MLTRAREPNRAKHIRDTDCDHDGRRVGEEVVLAIFVEWVSRRLYAFASLSMARLLHFEGVIVRA